MGREYFEDCQVGDRLTTRGRTITETDIVMFAAISGDWQPLHTDAEFARDGPFGTRIAHGMLSLVAGLNLLFRNADSGNGILPASIVALSGIDNIRFKRPVKIGDTLHLTCEITRMLPVPEQRGVIEIRFHILNQHDDEAISGRFSIVTASRDTQAGWLEHTDARG
jgi:acyl dehydratase